MSITETDWKSPLLTIEEIRATDPRLTNLSDEEIEEARELLYQLAGLILVAWKRERHRGSTVPDGSLKQEPDMV